MIPKIIHYCWFGRNSISEQMKKCIESWKTYCPDYQIICWNEDNFDITINEYVKKAYEEKSGLMLQIMLDFGLYTITAVFI